MKYLIVGLGNIGAEYAETRHNIGFNVLDALAEASNTVFTTQRYGDVAEAKYKGRTLVLLKPSTYMNLSGKAVRYWMDAGKIPPESLLVVSDDIALPFGTLRLRPKGSAGGHNGLKNISELLGTEEYARMRFGVGGDFPKGHQVEYVLGEWTDEERKALPERLKVFVDAIRSFATVGTQLTMTISTRNRKSGFRAAFLHFRFFSLPLRLYDPFKGPEVLPNRKTVRFWIRSGFLVPL